MTQAQMMAYLADQVGTSKRQAKSTLDELNELITCQLKKEGSLRLAGLGVLRKRKLKHVWAAIRRRAAWRLAMGKSSGELPEVLA